MITERLDMNLKNQLCDNCGKRPKAKTKNWCGRCIGIYRRKQANKVSFDDIPADYLAASFGDFDLPEIITDLNNDKNLYFYGNVGTGKTRMIYACLKYARSVLFYNAEVVEFTRLCSLIRKGFNSEGQTEWDIIQRYSKLDLLFLDDLGLSSNISDFAYLTLYQIIDRRISNLLPTIISSNKTIEQIGLDFDMRIASRLQIFKTIEFKGEDKRVK